MNNAVEHVMPMPEGDPTPQEKLALFVEGVLAPVDVRESLRDIVETASLIAGDVEAMLEKAKKDPKATLALLVGVAGVAASMALPAERPVGNLDVLPEGLSVPADIPDAIPVPRSFPEDIPYAVPRSIPHAIPLDRTIPYDLDIPFPKDGEKPLVDIAVPYLPPETEYRRSQRNEKGALTFRVYNIKPGDTLSDIINEEVYQRLVNPYRTDANGTTHFSDEFVTAATDIAVENLAVGNMRVMQLTPEGDPIGLTLKYNRNNENMTVEQQVHSFVLDLNATVIANPGNRDVLRDKFQNDISPELIPHVLRYLASDDNIYLPNYNLSVYEDDSSKSADKHNSPKHSKHFDDFGRRLSPNQRYKRS